MATDKTTITLDEQIQEVKRELTMRVGYYKKLVEKEPAKRQQLERQYLRMKAVLETIEKLRAEEQEAAPVVYDWGNTSQEYLGSGVR